MRTIKAAFTGVGSAQTHREGFEALLALESAANLPKGASALYSKTVAAFKKERTSALYYLKQLYTQSRTSPRLQDVFAQGVLDGLTRDMTTGASLYISLANLDPQIEPLFLKACIRAGAPYAFMNVVNAGVKVTETTKEHLRALGHETAREAPHALVYWEAMSDEHELLEELYDPATLRDDLMNIYRHEEYRTLVNLQIQLRCSPFFGERADDLKTNDLFWFQSRKLSTLAAEHKAFPHARYGNMDRYEGHCDYLFRERHDFGMIPLLSFLARNRDKIPSLDKKIRLMCDVMAVFDEYDNLNLLVAQEGYPEDPAHAATLSNGPL